MSTSDSKTGTFAGKHFVIVSIHYSPEETGIGPYSAGTAEYLASQGARVTVLTTMPFYPQWKTRDEYRRSLISKETHNGVEIRRIRQYIPTKQSAARRAIYELTFLGTLLRAPWKSKPDAVIGIIPSLSGGIVARAFARLQRIPYGIIVQDLSGQAAVQSGIAGGSRIARITSAIEGAVCRRAKRVAVVAPAFREPLKAMGVDSSSITEIRNWSHVRPPDADRAVTRTQLRWNASDFIVLHAGNMGLKQGLEHLIDAARVVETELPKVRFILMGDGNQRAFLEQRAAGHANVTFMELVPSSAFANVLAAADVLLVHERVSVTDMSLPSKLTSYFTAGRPVVAAVNPNGATAQEIDRASAGKVIPAEDSLALVHALRELLTNEAAARTYARAASVFAENHLSRVAAENAINLFVTPLSTSIL